MPYGSLLTDIVQSSTAGTPPQFNDGNGTQTGTLCRAWVNFNGTTSPGTIRASFNVGSVTKNGTGDYTINFTNAMTDANYVTCANARGSSGTAFGVAQAEYSAQTASASRVTCVTSAGGGQDSANVFVAIFR